MPPVSWFPFAAVKHAAAANHGRILLLPQPQISSSSVPPTSSIARSSKKANRRHGRVRPTAAGRGIQTAALADRTATNRHQGSHDCGGLRRPIRGPYGWRLAGARGDGPASYSRCHRAHSPAPTRRNHLLPTRPKLCCYLLQLLAYALLPRVVIRSENQKSSTGSIRGKTIARLPRRLPCALRDSASPPAISSEVVGDLHRQQVRPLQQTCRESVLCGCPSPPRQVYGASSTCFSDSQVPLAPVALLSLPSKHVAAGELRICAFLFPPNSNPMHQIHEIQLTNLVCGKIDHAIIFYASLRFILVVTAALRRCSRRWLVQPPWLSLCSEAVDEGSLEMSNRDGSTVPGQAKLVPIVGHLSGKKNAQAFEYKRLLFDYNTEVRRASATHEDMSSLIRTVEKGIAPHLKSLMGPLHRTRHG